MKALPSTRKGRPPAEPRPSRDLGTAELIRARCQAVGSGDPVLATTPLGIMLARQLIDVDLHQAGEEYRLLYARTANLARTFALDYSGLQTSDEEAKRAHDKFIGLRRDLKKMGLSVMQQVHDVAVYQMMPVWLMFAISRPHKHVWRVVKHHQDFIDLRNGLVLLAKRL